MTDALDRLGVGLVGLDEATVASMRDTARFATVMNPFDLGAGGSQNAHVNVPALAGASGVGVLVFVVTILQTETGMVRYAQGFVEAARRYRDLAVVVAAPAPLRPVEEELYRSAGIPVVRSTAEAANVVAGVQAVARARVRGVGPAVGSAGGGVVPEHPAVEALRVGVVPSEAESKALLGGYGVACPREWVVGFDRVGELGSQVSYPVVVKAVARDLAHKSEYGLVEVGVADAQALGEVAAVIRGRFEAVMPGVDGQLLVAEQVSGGCEVIVGLVRDPEFGLLAVVGPGGTGVELIGELHHLALPLSRQRLDEVLGRGVLGKLLGEHRGRPAADREALIGLIEGLAAAAVDLDEVVEAIELNPVMVGRGPATGAHALDALITPRS